MWVQLAQIFAKSGALKPVPNTSGNNSNPLGAGQLDGANWTVNYGTYTQPESTTKVLIIGAVCVAAVLIWRKKG